MSAPKTTQEEIFLTSLHSWPLRIISLLLLLQMVGICVITLYFLQQIDWKREMADTTLSVATLDILVWAAVATPLMILLLVTAIGFYFRRIFAWHAAMTLQGLMLLGCLTIYFFTESHLRDSHLIYLSMLYSIVMVLYLNTTDVRIAFHVRHVKTDLDIEDELAR